MKYVVTRQGTFGVVHKEYIDGTGEKSIVIRHGKLKWLTPVKAKYCFFLESVYESDAIREAKVILEGLDRTNNGNH